MNDGSDGSGTSGGGSGPATGGASTSASASVGTEAVTGTTTETTLTPIPVDILEFEDTLFNDGSAVMLPEVPGLDATADNAPMTGIKALGMGFIMAGLYPERGMLVTGHTAGGNTEESFQLSRQRASVVFALFQGDTELFRRTCAEKHTVQDYKQILKYVDNISADWKSGDWECDPGDIDNNFNDAAKTALNHFAEHFNSDLAAWDDDIGDLPATLGDIVNEATDNLLAQEYWGAIFHVYSRLICDLTGGTPADLADWRTSRLHWVNNSVKMVGCAHSYAVPDGERADDKIRSATDNRVELLIFQGNDQERDALAVCPTMPITAVHDLENDCPMWHERHFTRYYVGAGDRYAVVYHLKFQYFDRIKKELLSIPGRVNVKAFKRAETAGSVPEEISCITQFQDGMHTVRVRFGEENPDFTGKLLYFEFEAPEHEGTPVVRMIHTSGPDATPHVVNRPDDWTTKTFAQKYQYYDLPMKWSSHNYFTRHESTPANDERFHAHIKEKRQLKPFGANVTAQDQPLIFSLDDIVLFDADTHDQNIQDANQAGAAKALCAGSANPGSRVKVFIVDPDNHVLKLWQKPDNDYTSAPPPPSGAPAPSSPGSNITTAKQERIRFERNLVSGAAPNAKIVHFRDDFYAVSDKRTTDQPANWMDLAHKPVLGARKAIRDDANVHLKWERLVSRRPLGYTGDYELHYFHQMYLEDAHPVSFMFVYISMNFMLSSKGAQARTAWSALAANPGLADISNFVNIGVYNANDRWNQKRFYYDETTSSDSSLLIKPFYLFDERETFEIPLADSPSGMDYKTLGGVASLVTNAGVVAAKAAAFGGPVKWLTCISPESDGSWAWSIRSGARPHSVMSLRKSTWDHPTGAWSYQTGGYTEDGDSYGCLVFAHELGHATSLQDEYIKTESIDIGGDKRSHFSYSHHLIQYTMNPNNDAAMMFHNGVPRLRHCWYHLHHLNTTIAAIPTADAHILKNKTFALRFKRGSKDHTFSRNVNWTPDGTDPVVGSPSIKSDIRVPVIEEGQARLPNTVVVTAAPDLTTLTAPLRAKVGFNATGNILSWTDAGVMSDTDRDALRGLFTAAANKNKVNDLQKKSRCLRRLYLALYDVGQDESSEGETSSKATFTTDQAGYRYHGVLIVRVMVGVKVGAPAMSAADVHAKLGWIKAAWVSLNQKYRLTGGPDEIENVYIHFIPGFKAQADAGTDCNYAMQFVTRYSATLTGTIDTTTLAADLSAKVTYTGGTHILTYSGIMTSAHRTALRAAVVVGDRARIDTLYEKSNLFSTDGQIDSAATWTGTRLRKHFLNMQGAETELEALKFLETWINDKLSASYTLAQIPSGTP